MKSCTHAACGCLVEKEEMYCSEHCREEWEGHQDPNASCHCGHTDCLGERGVQRDDEALGDAPEDTPQADHPIEG